MLTAIIKRAGLMVDKNVQVWSVIKMRVSGQGYVCFSFRAYYIF